MTSDYSEDIKIGKDTLKNTSDLYRRIRNTLRFILGALDGFNASEKVDMNDLEALPELEQLMLHQLHEMDGKVRGHIENFEYGKLAKELHDFCNNNLSAFYFDIRKDRLYCDAPDSFERRATRSVMAAIFDHLTVWLAPILSFTTEEAWSHRPVGIFEDTESVHLRTFPEVPANWQNQELTNKWVDIILVRKVVISSLEEYRAQKLIGSSLEAAPDVMVPKFFINNLNFDEIDFAEICITSTLNIIAKDNDSKTFSSLYKKADGEKCARCWKVLPEVAEHADNICNRCDEVTSQKKAA